MPHSAENREEPLKARSKCRRRRQETLFFLFFKGMNESSDLDSYKIGFLNGLLRMTDRLVFKLSNA